VKIPALAKNDDDRRVGEQQGLHITVLFDLDVSPPGTAEGGQPGVLQANGSGPREEFEILRIRSGIAGFDIVDAMIVQNLEQFQLILDREGNSLGLGAIAQRRIKNRNFLAHLKLS